MLAETTAVPSLLPAALRVSASEAILFDDLMDDMPAGWGVNFALDAGMEWAAFIHRADDPRNGPLFTVCRWTDRVGLFVRWREGSTSSIIVSTELSDVLDLSSHGIFAFSAACLTTVRVESWADTMH